MSQVEFLKKLPSAARCAEALGFEPKKYLLIYDRRLLKNPTVAEWLGNFPCTYGVRSGESLKDLGAFPGHVKDIFKRITPFSSSSFRVIALGGGSVGDFSAFLSSVLKRGVPLIHIPGTLLAALDSAHGGKTALNVGSVKNQIGTFYPAHAVFIVKSLFEGLPVAQLQSAAGEVAKMTLLEGGDLWLRFATEYKPDFESLWELLPEVFAAKYRLVDQHPKEQSGGRQLLNFGHTLGHALESAYGLPHGTAVGHGLIFALLWSEHQGFLNKAECERLLGFLNDQVGFLKPREFSKKYGAFSRGKLMKLVAEDKKLTDSHHLSFIFLEKTGAAFRKVVTIESLLTEAQRQGWARL